MKSLVLNKISSLYDFFHSVSPPSLGIFNGKMGLVNFFFNHYLVFEEESSFQKVENLVEEVVNALANKNFDEYGASFAEGMAGIGYLLSVLDKKKVLDQDLSNILKAIDEYLFEEAYDMLLDDNFDYLYGALGIVYYFQSRLPNTKVEKYLNSFINLIGEKAIQDELGIRFPSTSKDGKLYVNFSLSHGLTGILLVLIQVYKKGLQNPLIRDIVVGGIQYMLNFRGKINFSEGNYGYFPFAVFPELDTPNFGKRLGWCYGDLNQTILLYRSNEIIENPAYKKLGDLVGTQTLMRQDVESTAINDIYFCHGTAGLAQFYKTLYDISGLKSYYQGYEYWLEQTLLYLYENPQLDNFSEDFLEGLGGVGLTFLSFISKENLSWSKAILL
ncbi:MAG: lanthionine synthetase LanC family protein [Bacteroidota bacterium]